MVLSFVHKSPIPELSIARENIIYNDILVREECQKHQGGSNLAGCLTQWIVTKLRTWIIQSGLERPISPEPLLIVKAVSADNLVILVAELCPAVESEIMEGALEKVCLRHKSIQNGAESIHHQIKDIQILLLTAKRKKIDNFIQFTVSG